jgi:hypothetical protein
VKHVPVRTSLLEAVQDAGFQHVVLTKFGPRPCFEVEGAELRETIIEARTPAAGCCDERFDVVYKGPFAEIRDDEGHVYLRGMRVAICGATWRALETAGVAGQFTRLAARTGQPVSCGVEIPT